MQRFNHPNSKFYQFIVSSPKRKKFAKGILHKWSAIRNLKKIVYAKRMLRKFKKQEGTQYIVCPFGIGDTIFIASLIRAYKLHYQKGRICLIVKKNQESIPDFFDAVDEKIVSDYLVSCLIAYSKTKHIFSKWNYQYGHFILDNFWPEPGQMLGIKDLNLIDIYKQCVLRIPPEVRLQEAKVMIRKTEMLQYQARYAGLDKVVVLFPYAVTIQRLQQEFWIKIACLFKQKGYKVYTNVKDATEPAVEGTEALELSLLEIFVLSRTFQWECVALRSGICDLLGFSNVKLTVIYENESLRRGWHMEAIGLPNQNIKDVVLEQNYTCDQNADHFMMIHCNPESQKENEEKQMETEYIIVQAGGKGTRLEYLTENKPKALVPVSNLPMIFHLFHKFPNKKFIIIGDYKVDVLEKYMHTFAKVKYLIVNANGYHGTCAGIQKAVQMIPENQPFLLIWSDLVLPEEFQLPKAEGNYIGLSKGFSCRWSYQKNQFEESPSSEYGVAGLFLFQNKKELRHVPMEGEFVRWLKESKKIFSVIDLVKTKEFGILKEYQRIQKQKCRPFNRLTVEKDRIIKEGIDEQGKKLANIEKAWYKAAREYEITKIPQIYSFDPLTMQKIDGKNIYEYENLTYDKKKKILEKIIESIQGLHAAAEAEVDYFSLQEAYMEKTIKRLETVRELIPYANKQAIVVNGKNCPNVYFYFDQLKRLCQEYQPTKFTFIHGDCTFSNMLLDSDEEVIFIDPRGYFGYTEQNGDPMYDWAKLFYSIVGNYDQFNLKNFKLHFVDGEVKLDIASNHWEDMEELFFELLEEEVSRKTIYLLHAIIWLSLTTYAWEDYDSICGAFYKGIYHLADLIEER